MNANRFADALCGGLNNVCLQREYLDAINVFPVPDRDTGRNLVATLSGMFSVLRTKSIRDFQALYELISREAIQFARGNSGMIFSQFLKGWIAPLRGKTAANSDSWPQAWRCGRDLAYACVARPRQGTILSLLDVAAMETTRPGTQVEMEGLERLLHVCGDALLETPKQLAALDRAGVVDAGGLALVLLLEGMVLVEGNEQIPPSSQWIARHLDSGIVSNGGRNSKAENEYSSRYCVELLLEGPTGDLENVLDRLLSFCESLEKAWDNGRVRVHLHTDQPFAIRNLVPEDVYVLEMSVEDMRYQTHIFDDRRESIRPTGLAALVSGSGFARILESMGLDYVLDVEAGPYSAEDLKQKLERIRCRKLLIVSTHGTRLSAIRKIGDRLSTPSWELMMVENEAEAVAACLAFNPNEGEEINHRQFVDAVRHTVSGSLISDSVTGEYRFKASRRTATSAPYRRLRDAGEALVQALRQNDSSLITLYAGAGLEETLFLDLEIALAERFPDLTVERLYGGQRHSLCLVSVE